MENIKSFLTSLLYKLGIRKQPEEPVSEADETEAPKYAGPQIISTANAVFVHHNDNVALVVDHEFEDVPSWVEWDGGQNKLVIAHMGGNMTELSADIDDKYIAEYRERKKLYLVSNQGENKVVQLLSFIAREA